MTLRSGAGGGVQTIPVPNNASANVSASGWATGLTQKDQYEWFSNCYQMRCDDDYAWGGCHLHGPYDPDATPESIVHDFLVFCTLAKRANTVPQGWDWKAYLKLAHSRSQMQLIAGEVRITLMVKWVDVVFASPVRRYITVQLIRMKTAWSMIKSKKRLIPAK